MEEPIIKCRGKVLLMDDEAIIRLSASDLLCNLKYKVETAKDGTKAIELYERAIEEGEPFDAVILDLRVVRGMGGEETIKNLLEIDPDVKAIIMSGYLDSPVMINFTKYGFKAVVAKPYEIHELDKALQRVITGIA